MVTEFNDGSHHPQHYTPIVHEKWFITSKITAPQDAHRKLVLQVYLGSNTSEFSDT